MVSRHTVITSLREVDCSKYGPIVKHPHVLRLNDVDQLSFVDKVYRGAKHSRYDHSIFVYHFTDEITNHLQEKACINPEEKTNTEIAAILHDLRHPPYSHASGFLVEALGKERGETIDHKIKALELIEDEKKDREGRTLK
jgi:HD superfamily phosphohydrolase